MSRHIPPFGQSCNHGFVQRHARLPANALSADKADAPLRRQQMIQHNNMRRCCITHRTIADELAAIKNHIRATAWPMVLTATGVA